MMRVTISGTTYRGACDPRATDVPREEGWPTATSRKVGKGWQYRYDVTPAQAALIAEHLENLADAFGFTTDADARSEARAFRRDATRIRTAIRESVRS